MIEICSGVDAAGCLAAWGQGAIVAEDPGLPKMLMDIIGIITALATVGATWVAAYFGLRDRKPRLRFGAAVIGKSFKDAADKKGTLLVGVFFSGVGPLPAVVTAVRWQYFWKTGRRIDFSDRLEEGWRLDWLPLSIEYGKSHQYILSSNELNKLTTAEDGPNWLPPKVKWRWQLAWGLRIKATAITGEQFTSRLPEAVVDVLWEGVQKYRKINPRGA